jgi:hypothetical protein
VSDLPSRISGLLHEEAAALGSPPGLDRRIAALVRSKQRRRRARIVVPVAVLAASGIGAGLLGLARTTRTPPTERSAAPAIHSPATFSASAGPPTTARHAGLRSPGAPAAVLSPEGIGSVHFGEPAATATRRLEAILGSPAVTRSAGTAHPQPVPLQPEHSCDVGAFVAWPQVAAYFDHGRFVGYASTDRVLGAPAGLRIGESVSEAEKSDKGHFAVSFAQGGSYTVTLRTGQLDGLLDGLLDNTGSSRTSTEANASIASIDAGAVGCPGIAP